MTSDARLIRDLETKLQALNLSPEEEAKKRKQWYKTFEIIPMGFISKDLELPEGSILIGVFQGELKQAVAREGSLWVDGKACAAISSAAAEATGRPTQYGWNFWDMVYIPRSGFVKLEQIRVSEPRKNGKRK